MSCRRRPQGWVSGSELLWIKPHNSVGTGLSDGVIALLAGEQLSIDPDFDAAYRSWIGYTRCDGLGWRVTYWRFDSEHDEDFNFDDDFDLEVEQGWDASYIDVEAMFTTNWCGNLDATFSGGVRFVDYEESLAVSVDDFELGEAATNFESIGLTAALELRYRMGCNFGLYGRARSSIVMDDEDISVELFDEELEFTQKNDVRMIHEIAIGAEYILPICGGGYYFLRGGAEMSYWDGFGLNTTGLGLGLQNSSSAGFGGFSIAAGVQR